MSYIWNKKSRSNNISSITLKADKVLNEEIYDYDVVVLPGGMPGAVNLRDDEKVNELIKGI